MLTIREAVPHDAEALHELYMRHLVPSPPEEPQDMAAWAAMLAQFAVDPGYHLLVGELEGKIVSSVTVIVIQNLPRNLRPYALIENVVTHGDFRKRGYARALMDAASAIAKESNCYKIMLLTGSKLESTLRFYEGCGFNSDDKTGFIKWL
ncbi:MAG: GNAT family N-acetyltransferase [Oscillospiraceae bacterium]|nr:GNAT family N-acetyltransferase [Oscillospiraceae bacterium]